MAAEMAGQMSSPRLRHNLLGYRSAFAVLVVLACFPHSHPHTKCAAVAAIVLSTLGCMAGEYLEGGLIKQQWLPLLQRQIAMIVFVVLEDDVYPVMMERTARWS